MAGKRAGLSGERSGLFFEFVRIIQEMRDATDGAYPKFAVLENVPGLLSSRGGRDITVVLRELKKLGAVDICWRILDAQYFGVPQRRRRVFIVASFGTNPNGAYSVLFESEGSRGDSPAGGEAGQELAYCLAASAGSSSSHIGNGWNTTYIAATLRSRNHAPGVNPPGRGGEDDQNLVIIDEQNAVAVPMVGALSSGGAHQNRGFSVVTPVMAARAHGANGAGIGQAGDPMFSLDTTGAQAVIANTVQASAGHHGHSSPRGDGNDNLVVAKALNTQQRGVGDPTAETFVVTGTLGSTDLTGNANETSFLALAENQRGELRTADVSPALGGGGGKPGSGFSAAWNGSTVRRLLPVETERLQGWPDGWTRWTFDGKELPDGARYRLIGNGVAAPVARWIAQRILELPT